MAKSERQIEHIEFERNLTVSQSNEMIQKGRHKLSLREQKCVLYAISKIKPEDTAFSEYTFDIKDFYAVCGIEKESYSELKEALTGLKSKTWWIETAPGEESTVSWFNKVRTNKKSGKVTIRFDDDMMPYLLNLVNSDEFYTSVTLKYVLPMNSQYAPKLYELLKSYQRNNEKWFFETEKLKRNLGAENYTNFKDFRLRVLEPAVADINKYTDLNVAYRTEKEGKRVSRVIFYMFDKQPQALLEAEREGAIVLDGQIDIEDYIAACSEDEEEQRIRKFIQDNMNAK